MVYFVFAWNDFYPGGGVNDCYGIYETPDEARERANTLFYWHGMTVEETDATLSKGDASTWDDISYRERFQHVVIYCVIDNAFDEYESIGQGLQS